jgi:hypothetical protein
LFLKINFLFKLFEKSIKDDKILKEFLRRECIVMKCIYEQPMKVLSSWTDINMELGLAQALSVVQDNMCEYFRELKCDGPTMVPVCNCFLVVTKTKIKFNKFLKGQFHC